MATASSEVTVISRQSLFMVLLTLRSETRESSRLRTAARTEGGIKDFGIRYSVARDADASVARQYNATGTPTIVFVPI